MDIKRWKYKGQFVNKYLTTCPQAQFIDCRNDRPFEEATFVSGTGMLRQTKKHISEQSKAYLNRIDTYVLDEENFEVTVIDDYGVRVMYDASLQDMVSFEDELLKIGTHFVKKNELDFSFERYEYALVDRVEVLTDLLQYENEYQFMKV